jgi:transcriptional regulator with XRE-family HTH domain
LGTLLREQRIKRGLTQADLAESLGNVHPQFVSNWERGLCAPPSERLREIISHLQLTPKKVIDTMMTDAKEEILAKIFPKAEKKSASAPKKKKIP